jgi:predicted enzyme related to lactoylglutathione lyase
MTTMTQHAAGMFCWSELATTDQEGAKKFYRSLFDWSPDDTPMGEGETYTLLKKNGKEVSALYTQREKGMPANWMPYVAVDSADATAAKVKQSGGKVLMEPFDVMEHGRMAVCQDPTGGTFSLWEAKKHTGAGIVNEPSTMTWNELITDDSAKAGAFYRQVFGWTEEPMPMPQGTYTIFKKEGAQAAGMIKATPEMKLTHPYWLIYFAVDDCDKSAARAKQLGGSVMLEPKDIPNIGRFSVLTDPQGAYFAIIAVAK